MSNLHPLFQTIVDHQMPTGVYKFVPYQPKIAELELTIKLLREENRQLRSSLAQATETIELVCCGAGIECPECGKQRPCLCHDRGESPSITKEKL
jgi:hypothetical protein